MPNLKRIIKEDFSPDDQQLVDKLAFPINSFFEQTRQAFDGQIDFTNMSNLGLATFSVNVDANGNPNTTTQVRSSIGTSVIGVICISAINTTTPGAFVNSYPFVSITNSGTGILSVNNVTGLTANENYTLTVLLVG